MSKWTILFLMLALLGNVTLQAGTGCARLSVSSVVPVATAGVKAKKAVTSFKPVLRLPFANDWPGSSDPGVHILSSSTSHLPSGTSVCMQQDDLCLFEVYHRHPRPAPVFYPVPRPDPYRVILFRVSITPNAP